MINKIIELMHAQPFVPFVVNVADGREFSVPSLDHVHINPGGKQVTIFTDKGLLVVLPGILVSGLVLKENHPEPSV